MKLPCSRAATLLCITAAATLAACVDAPPDDDLGESEQWVEGGTLASAGKLARAAKLRNCTATRISPRHVITALHCRPAVGDKVQFYAAGPFPDGTTRKVAAVTTPPGTSFTSTSYDWTDTSDRIADIAVLTLDNPDTTGAVATLAWTYPGIEVAGVKVGAGQHEDNPALSGLLMNKSDLTWSDSDAKGGFYTEEFALNDGDSGGAFYVGPKLLGVTHGAHLLGVWRGRFTSVPAHLSFILSAIGYAWPGDAPEERVRSGAIIGTSTGTHKSCQYACDNTSGCVAYSYLVALSSCSLLGSVTGSAPSSSFRSALR